MHVPTLLSQARGSQIIAHETWPANLSTANLSTKCDKTKLWRPALCCEDLMSYIRISLVLMAALCCKNQRPYVFRRNSLMLWQPCAAETWRPFVFLTDQPSLSYVSSESSFSAFSSTEEQLLDDQGMRNDAKHGPAITPGSIQSIKGNIA